MKNIQILKTLTAGVALAIAIYPQAWAGVATPCGANEANCWSCGDDCSARLDSFGKMTVEGSGAMNDYSYKQINNVWHSEAPWDSVMSQIKSVEIGNNIKTVGQASFMSAMNLSDVKLGNSVEKISGQAFYMGDYKNVAKLQNIVIPASVTEIGNHAFNGGSLSQITFESDKNLKTIGNGTFRESSLISIDIPDSVEQIGDLAFWKCPTLTNVHLPANLKTLGTKVFEYAGITVLEFPAGITYIPDRTCAYCSNLKKVVVKGDNVSIYYNAFHGSGVTDVESSEAVKNALLSYFSSQLGRNVTWTEYFEQKPKRTYYTPAEALQHVNHTNKNKIIFTFK